MPWTIDSKFKIPINQDVVNYILKNPTLSARDEITDALIASASGLSDVRRYCPDVHSYAYMVLHTQNNRIFGMAIGQSAIAYRLPHEFIQDAVADGAIKDAGMGNNWVVFSSPWSAAAMSVLQKWCKIAHDRILVDSAGGA